MAGEKPDVLLIAARKPVIVGGLDPKVTLHYLLEAKDQDAFIKSVAGKVRAIVIAHSSKVDAAFMQRFPSSSRSRASASATITSTPNGRARTASSSPTRRKC